MLDWFENSAVTRKRCKGAESHDRYRQHNPLSCPPQCSLALLLSMMEPYDTHNQAEHLLYIFMLPCGHHVMATYGG